MQQYNDIAFPTNNICVSRTIKLLVCKGPEKMFTILLQSEITKCGFIPFDLSDTADVKGHCRFSTSLQTRGFQGFNTNPIPSCAC